MARHEVEHRLDGVGEVEFLRLGTPRLARRLPELVDWSVVLREALRNLPEDALTELG